MMEQYFYCYGVVLLISLLVVCGHVIVGDSLDPLSADQVARLRKLASEHQSINRMAKKWVAKNKTLRRHHLTKAEGEARYILRRAEYEREQHALAEQVSLLARE